MFRHILFTLFCFIAQFANLQLFGQIPDPPQDIVAPESEYELLWEITGNGLDKPSWLFGTFHTRDERAFKFPDSLMIALDQCEAIATELDPDSLMQFSYQIQLVTEGKKGNYDYYYSGPTRFPTDYKSHIKTLPVYDIPRVEEWLYDTQDAFKILSTQSKYPTFLDAFLYRLAVIHGKQFLPVETVAEQIRVFEERYEENEIEESEENEEEGLSLFGLGQQKELITLYQKGDITEMNRLMEKLYARKKSYFKALITDRNKVMAERINKMVFDKSYFVAVGAGHLGGPEGVVKLLEAQGFTLRPIKATYSKKQYAFKSPETEIKWKKIDFPTGNLTAEMPRSALAWPLPSWNSHIWYAPDISTGTAYYLSNFNLEGLGKFKTKKLLDGVRSEFADLPRFMLLDEKNIDDGDKTGREWIFRMGKTEKMLVRCIIEGNQGIVAGVVIPSNMVAHSEVERFWSKIKFKPEPPINKWTSFENLTAGFKINLPVNKHQGQMLERFDEGELSYSNYISASDPESRINYRVIWVDPDKGNYHTEDTTTLDFWLENMAEETGCEMDNFIRYDHKNGFPTAEGTMRDSWTDSYYRVRIAARGSRIYAFIASSVSQDGFQMKTAPFFNSIEIKPPVLDELSLYEDKNSNYSVLLPNARQIINDSALDKSSLFYLWGLDVSGRKSVAATGAQTGFAYSLVEETFSPYVEYETDSAFFKEAIDVFLADDEEIISEKIITFQGNPAAEYELKMPKTEQVVRIREVWNGKVLVSLIQVYLPGYADKGPDQVWNSLKVSPEPDGIPIVGSKKEIILQDLLSDDPEKVDNASNWTKSNQLDSIARIRIWDRLESLDTNIDPEYAIRSNLLSALSEDAKESEIERLKDQYMLFPANNDAKFTILETLASLQTENSIRAFTQLLISNPPDSTDFFSAYRIFLPLRQSVPHHEIIFPALLDQWDKPEIGKEIISLFDIAAEKDILNPVDYPQVYSIVKTALVTMHGQDLRAEQEEEGNSDEEGDWDPELENNYNKAYLFHLLGYFDHNEPWEKEVADYYYERGEPFERLPILMMRIRKGYKPTASDLNQYDERSGLLRNFYKGLKALNRLDLFPESLMNQKSFAKSDLYDYLGDDGVTDIIITQKLEDESFPEGKFVYFCELVYEGEDSYAGFSGLFSENEDDFDSNRENCGSAYYLFDDYSPEKHLELYLEEY